MFMEEQRAHEIAVTDQRVLIFALRPSLRKDLTSFPPFLQARSKILSSFTSSQRSETYTQLIPIHIYKKMFCLHVHLHYICIKC